MSEDLIRRSDAIKALARLEPYAVNVYGAIIVTYSNKELQTMLRAIPSADRPQEEWIDKGDYAECSNCGAYSGTQFDGVEPIPLKTRFCSNCGAKMKGVDDE